MRKALCVGIDNYTFGALSGCVNDASRIAGLLSRHFDNSPNFECKVASAPLGGAADAVTRASLRQQLDALFKSKGDCALFHFSGHGTVNNLDGFLVTQDAMSYDEGVAMSEVLQRANSSAASEVVILLDCCFSGALGNPPVVDNTKSLLREGVSILTASRGDQPSVETGGGGLFTSLVVDALDGGAADPLGNVTSTAVYAYVDTAFGAWEQRPLLKSHVSRLVALRHCRPPIPREILRRLPQLFPLPAEDRALDPSYEESSGAPDPGNVAIFKDLQALSRVHLVTPVDSPHMYQAAINSRSCRLTPTGRYYWRLAEANRI